jgi:hypothetical protein
MKYSIVSSIGVGMEPIEVVCEFHDDDDEQMMCEIYSVIFKQVDILGCLSGKTLDELEVECELWFKKHIETEKTEARISEWESKND